MSQKTKKTETDTYMYILKYVHISNDISHVTSPSISSSVVF